MKRVVALFAFVVALHARDAAAAEPPYAYPWVFRALSGLGETPGASLLLSQTLELGRRPFGGAFSAGVSGTFANGIVAERYALDQWWIAALGIYMKVDLTYVFLSGLWSEKDDTSFACFPFRIQTGGRIGVALSDSYGVSPPYWLARFELSPFMDVELPLGRRRAHAFVFRVAADTPVALTSIFRWSVSIGWEGSWGS